MRPSIGSRCGKTSKSRSVRGPMSIWPPSPGTGIQRWQAWISPATPSPVPGPSTTRPAAGSAVPAADLFHMLLAERHHGQRLRLEIVEHDHVVRARDWRTSPAAAPPMGNWSSRISSPSTGPATASTAERGCTEVRSSIGRLDRVVDGGEIGRLHDRKLDRLGIRSRPGSRSAHWCRRCRRSGSETAAPSSSLAAWFPSLAPPDRHSTGPAGSGLRPMF